MNATMKCHCGRPLGHSGRHQGGISPAKKTDGPKSGKTMRRSPKDKLLAMIDKQIEAGVAAIAGLRREIREREKLIREREAELAPLRGFAETYRAPRIAGPQSSAVTRITDAEPPPAAMEDYEPIAADFNTVTAWATEQKIGFKSWDDLPRVNSRREAQHQPIFKRALRPAKTA